MSLILDAIKKSERERQQQGVPDLSSNHEGYQEESESRAKWVLILPVLVVLVIVIYFGVMKVFFGDGSEIDLNQTNVAVDQQVDTNSTVPKTAETRQPTQRLNIETATQNKVEPVQTVKNPVLQTKPVIVERPIAEKTVLVPQTIVASKAIATKRSLSASLQGKLPAIEFSSHVFTGDPATSFVVINDELVGVGETLENDIEIIEISKEGIVIEYEDEQAFITALQNWTP